MIAFVLTENVKEITQKRKVRKKFERKKEKKEKRSICKRHVRYREEYVTSVISTRLLSGGEQESSPFEGILMEEGGCWP